MSAPRSRASLSFGSGTRSPSPESKRAAKAAAVGVGESFPATHNQVIVRKRTLSPGTYAETYPPVGTKSTVAIDPVQHAAPSSAQSRGRKTYTLTHEMGIHSVPDLTHASGSGPQTTADHDHRGMFLPGRRDAYIDMVRGAFKAETTKKGRKAIAAEFQKDIEDHIGMDPGLAPPVAAEAGTWGRARAVSMDNAAEGLGDHDWLK
jgi:hypothetical protein